MYLGGRAVKLNKPSILSGLLSGKLQLRMADASNIKRHTMRWSIPDSRPPQEEEGFVYSINLTTLPLYMFGAVNG